MSKLIVASRTLAALLCGLTAGVPAAEASVVAADHSSADTVRVLVVYHSLSGNTEALAGAVAEGATNVAGTAVVVKPVAEVMKEDLESADALLIGSPTYWGTISAPVKQFIDDWGFTYGLFFGDKVGGAFATGGGDAGGKELTILTLVTAMLNNGMVVVGPHYEEGDTRYGGFGAGATTGPTDPGLSDSQLDSGRRLGERVAQVAGRMKRGKGSP